MNAQNQLRHYIASVRRRLRWWASARGAATLAATALALTVALVAIANHFDFIPASLAWSRLALIVGLAAAAGFGLAWPLERLRRRPVVTRLEHEHPEFEQRLATFDERGDADPFAELLAEDGLAIAQQVPLHRIASPLRIRLAAAAGAACLAALIWLVAAGPGTLGYGASLLWTGPQPHAAPLYTLTVKPGNATVRRHGDAVITALPRGWASPTVELFARYHGSSAWQQAPMQPAAAKPSPNAPAGGFQYQFAALNDDVDYYVQSGAVRSPTFHLRVQDLPSIQQIAVTYHYPAWSGMKDASNARAGDLSAVAGTRADLTLSTDQPLRQGQLEVSFGPAAPQPVALTALGHNRYRATLTLSTDGVYHVASNQPGDAPGAPTRISEDYFIAAPPPAPPQVALARPGRDYRASPIEEVTVALTASDAYGLRSLDLHYSVNGAPEKVVPLLSQPGAKQAAGQTSLSLESFHAQPGDLISLYATARDGRATAHTAMQFIQADPFERDFSQSQSMGGGGGGGGGNQGNV
ncbi:MAG: hypothetical protein ACRD1M_07025, partial [Terriglobales bacterium]